jgi:hypothetical protein
MSKRRKDFVPTFIEDQGNYHCMPASVARIGKAF